MEIHLAERTMATADVGAADVGGLEQLSEKEGLLQKHRREAKELRGISALLACWLWLCFY